jgi:hypothetical protein
MGHALKNYDLHEKRKLRATFEISNVDVITPKMWNDLRTRYKSILNFSLSELFEMNIVRILFIDNVGYEIKSIGNTPFRTLVLPHNPEAENVLRNSLRLF